MHPDAIDSGALKVSCQTKRNESQRPARPGYMARRYRTGPPACGIAAPNSAHTMPSQTTSAAPSTHPSIACGPCIVATISGMVMNGPTPIMSIMFSAVASARPMPRTRRSVESRVVVSDTLKILPSPLLFECDSHLRDGRDVRQDVRRDHGSAVVQGHAPARD